MAYFELINKICEELNLDGCVYEDGDNEGQEVLQVCDWSDVKALNNALYEKFKELGVDTSDIDWKANLEDKYAQDYVDFATDNNWVFSDESFVCDGCYKLYRQETYGYANYYIPDSCGGIYCVDCIKEDPTDFVEHLINNPKTANTILDRDELENLGFERDEETYASGWYGRDERPEKVLEGILARYPKAEVVFNVVKTYNPFETEYEAFIKKNEED